MECMDVSLTSMLSIYMNLLVYFPPRELKELPHVAAFRKIIRSSKDEYSYFDIIMSITYAEFSSNSIEPRATWNLNFIDELHHCNCLELFSLPLQFVTLENLHDLTH